MVTQLELGDITVEVVLKDIKNVHLSVHPPSGRVSISAPNRMSLDTIRVYAISRLGWIKRQQKKLQEQERESVRDFIDRESHYVWGKRYLLKVVERNEAPSVKLRQSCLVLNVRPGAHLARRAAVVEEFYREQVKSAAKPLIAKWEPLIGVHVDRVFVRRMKTKWGSCNPDRHTIRLNTDLAKKPPACLEYIVVHEMVHFLEPTHNARFIALMDQVMPQWRSTRDQLNQLPVRHEDWHY